MKFAKGFAVLSLSFIIAVSNITLAASKYTDVAESHWAYSSIISIAEKGYMVGNISGEYKPGNPIDKFDTSKILAMAAGYKYSSMSESEALYYERAYNNYKALLETNAASYTKWNTATDREIAYLLEKGIYSQSDLSTFIVKNGNTENLRALFRQEAAMYLTKLVGKASSALTAEKGTAFADDSKIGAEYKAYVYYLRSQGVASGDISNNFNPNNAVTRAEMAVMLNKILNLAGNNLPSSTAGSSTNSNTSNAVSYTTFMGKVDKIHSSLNAVQIKYSTGETKIHKLDSAGVIYVDSTVKTIYNLTEGMSVVGILKDNNIAELNAVTQSNTQAAQTTNAQTAASVEYRTLQGTITNVKSSIADNRSVTIEVRIINPNGGIIVERETFSVGDDCRVTRNGVDVDFSTAVTNDVVKAKVSSGKAYVLELEEKDRRMNVVIVDKKVEETLGTQFYTVEDSQGKTHEMVVGSNSVITRKGMGTVNFADVRIGDRLDLLAEYSVIKEAYAYGEQGYTEGTISEINITNDRCYINLIDSSGVAKKYYVISGAFDVYTLRLNSKVRLRLDSSEIQAISVLQEANLDYYTGYVDSISSQYIMLRSGSAANTPTTRVFTTTNTLVTDSTTGEKVNLSNLYKDMKVYVVFENGLSDVAKSITILTK